MDSSNSYFGLARLLLIGVSFWYSYKLIPVDTVFHVIENKWKINSSQSSSVAFLFWAFSAIFIFGLISIGSQNLNYSLLEKDNKTAKATIRNCYNSKGAEYCVYSYFINGNYYEHKFNNQTYRFKNDDTIQIRYYEQNPTISRIADLEE